MSRIEWTDETWNPTVGCRRVSPGCEHCYAEGVAHRAMQEAHMGLTVLTSHGPRWTGDVRLLPDRLPTPLKWKRPRLVFVDSMSDLFHEEVPFQYIAAVFGVMAAASAHTFQVLTKRPERAVEFFEWLAAQEGGARLHACFEALRHEAIHHPDGDGGPLHTKRAADPDGPWPLPNVWMGVSVEDRLRTTRIDSLREIPATLRFLSCEPLLQDLGHLELYEIDWVIVGGESGPGARPMDVRWAASILGRCNDAGVPCFIKQLGARPYQSPHDVLRGVARELRISDSKGGNLEDWPEELRVRQFPEVR